MFFHPSFIFDDLFFEVVSGQCLSQGSIPDDYYGIFTVPEGARRLHYSVTGIVSL